MVQEKGLRKGQEETPSGVTKPGNKWPSLFDDYDRWFDDLLPRRWWSGLPEQSLRGRWPQRHPGMPKVDVVDQDKQLVVRAEIPGVDRENLDVSVADNLVTIRGRSHHEETKEEGVYFRREISHGEFERTVALPSEVDADKARARFENGILELTLPKVNEVRRRQIKVE
ncbi:Hsp20/alpha crystallin family protein [Aquisalimonas sp.]|uniref:Hsp20/alpha crystallin family protein n=1 Tax=unclassified Aquisalimonas TaxID=2644645 RepID=UPI0025C1B7F7|nr:Hsp20/alpha crystallin family protein [Aquisalimonas sp.]